ncbi:hypothetical protein GEMRC1_003408 [Eukaryota sp. GEM-RC1]
MQQIGVQCLHELELHFSRLEAEINHTVASVEASASGDSDNSASSLLHRLHRCRKDCTSAHTVVDQFVPSFHQNASKLSHIHQSLPPCSEADTLASSTSTLTDLVSSLDSSIVDNWTDDIQYSTTEVNSQPPKSVDPHPRNLTRTAFSEKNTSHSEEPSPSRSSGDFIPITDDEFNGVSSIVRGRSKLSDLNELYRSLYDLFDGGRKKSTLSHEKACKLGLKVTGQTGEARLNTLRQLKIVHLSKKGITWNS